MLDYAQPCPEKFGDFCKFEATKVEAWVREVRHASNFGIALWPISEGESMRQ
jgi:hypothetical protein